MFFADGRNASRQCVANQVCGPWFFLKPLVRPPVAPHIGATGARALQDSWVLLFSRLSTTLGLGLGC